MAVKQKWGPAKPAREIHRVIPWDAVSEAEGTGIVHIARDAAKKISPSARRKVSFRLRPSTKPAYSCTASESLKADRRLILPLLTGY